jgi:hypothetical protein
MVVGARHMPAGFGGGERWRRRPGGGVPRTGWDEGMQVHSTDPEARGRRSRSPTEVAAVSENGMAVIPSYYNHGRGSMVAHRGVLHPDEYVDVKQLARQLEVRLDCTLEEFVGVYGRAGGGPLPKALRPLRARLDEALAIYAERGGSMATLGLCTGVPERNLQRAAKRGRN